MNIEELKKEQIELAKKIILKDDFDKVETIAGVDEAFYDNHIISAIVICNKDFKIIDKQYSILETKFSYKPGFLSFREGPAIIEAFKKLENRPDILLVNGYGIAHSRLGLASFVGLMLDQPTIGIAKNLLNRDIIEGSIMIDNEVKGYELKTKEGSNPIYISPGHKVSLKSSLEIVKNCIKFPHKLPEPLFLAHQYANKIKKEFG